jgi:hypothetical protein
MLKGVEVRCHIGLGTGLQQPISSISCNRLLLESLNEEYPIGHMVFTAPKVLLASGSAAETWIRDK